MKYELLKRHLEGAFQHGEVRLDFASIERILRFGLPRSAYEHQAWWSNTRVGHSHAAAWLDAGWKTAELDLGGRKVSFVKMRKKPASPHSAFSDQASAGVAESGATFQHRDAAVITLPIGALDTRALRMIDLHVEEHGGDRTSACIALLDQLANDRLVAMVEWFQKASKPSTISSADLIREGREERDAR